jgi:hypothetical protein
VLGRRRRRVRVLGSFRFHLFSVHRFLIDSFYARYQKNLFCCSSRSRFVTKRNRSYFIRDKKYIFSSGSDYDKNSVVNEA